MTSEPPENPRHETSASSEAPRQLPFDADVQERLDAALHALHELRDENRQLRNRLAMQEVRDEDTVRAPAHSMVNDGSPRHEKLALFRHLFRGREDVFAQRWEVHDGRRGYSPVLRQGVRRVRGVAPDPDDHVPLSDDAIRGHLEGRSTLGIYPLLQDAHR